jgi:hypothetical protein
MMRIAILVLSIFVMAGVYDVMWTFRPDYFRVQPDVNFLPLDMVQIADAYSEYSNQEPISEILPHSAGQTTATRIEEIYRKFRPASIALARKKAEYAQRSQRDATEHAPFDLTRNTALEDFRREIIADQSVADTLHRELYSALVDYRAATAAHLGYWDFLYFSVGAATTATFGDISPNSTSVRILVCLQVLGSIVFTGLMINALATSRG